MDTNQIAAAVKSGEAGVMTLWAAVRRFAYRQGNRWYLALGNRAGMEPEDFEQAAFLALLDAPRKIGLCATGSSILTPRKSVTAVMGVLEDPSARPAGGCGKGCRSCSLRGRCPYEKKEDTPDGL